MLLLATIYQLFARDLKSEAELQDEEGTKKVRSRLCHSLQTCRRTSSHLHSSVQTGESVIAPVSHIRASLPSQVIFLVVKVTLELFQ